MVDLEDDAGYFFFQSPWKNIFLWHFMDMKKEAFIVSRTLDMELLKKIQSILIARSSDDLKVRMLFRFSEVDFLEKDIDPNTLRILSVLMNDPSSSIEVRFASNITTTAVILDNRKAIIATGDLSLKELTEDVTYGILVSGSDIVEGIETDMNKIWNSSTSIDNGDLDSYRTKIEQKLNMRSDNDWDEGSDDTAPDKELLQLGEDIEPLGRDREEPHLDEEKKIIKELLIRARDAVEEDNTTTALFYLDEGLALDPKNMGLLLEKGKILFDVEKDYERALDCCEKILDQDEDNRDSWYIKGMCHHDLGDLDEALYCYDQATDIDPQYYPVWIRKGIILGKIDGREEDGLKCLEYALSQDPYNQEAWFNKGQILEQRLKRNDEGLMAYKSLMRVNPKHVKGNFRMALINYKKFNNIEKAKKHLDRVVDVDPGHFLAWVYKGEIADDENSDFEEAYRCFERAIEIEPDNLMLLEKEIELLLDYKRKFSRAVQLANRYLEIRPDSSLARYVSGLGKMRIDEDYEGALACFNESIKAQPENILAIIGKANLLAEFMGKARDSVNLLKTAIKRADDDKDLWMELGLVYFDFMYDPRNGLKCFDRVVEIDDREADGWYNRGLILNRGFEKHQEALNSLDKATDIDPDHNLAWYEKGRILHHVYNMTKDALACVRKSLEIEPNDPETLILMANIMSHMDRTEKAVEFYQHAIEADPGYIESYLQLAQMDFDRNMHGRSHETLTSALQVDPKNERVWMMKADVFRAQGELVKSLECYKRVLAVNPDNQEALNSKTSVEATLERGNRNN